MSTKAPIYLKRGSRKGKKEKLRDILSPAMISPPLGDFRHTSHVGPAGQGDTFGDLSFLQGNFHLLPGAGGGPQGPPFEFCRAATISGPRQELCLGASSSSLEASSSSSSCPLLKNAISLPIIGGPQALTLPSSQAPPKPPRLHLEEGRSLAPPPPSSSSSPLPPPSSSPPPPSSSPPLSSPLLPPQSSPLHPPPPSSSSPPPPPSSLEDPDPAFLSHTSSLLSLHLDLGPSILEEVLQVMDKHQAGPGGSGARRS